MKKRRSRSKKTKSPNVTIDLCDSDSNVDGVSSPSTTANVSASSKTNLVETITIDDDSFSAISEKTNDLTIKDNETLGSSKKRTLNENQENGDDIEVIAVQINKKERRASMGKKKKFGVLSPFTIYRGISANSRLKNTQFGNKRKGFMREITPADMLTPNHVLARGPVVKSRKAKHKKDKSFASPKTPFDKPKVNAQASARSKKIEQARSMLQNKEYRNTKFFQLARTRRDRKSSSPFGIKGNISKKIKLEFDSADQLVKEALLGSDIPNNPNISSDTPKPDCSNSANSEISQSTCRTVAETKDSNSDVHSLTITVPRVSDMPSTSQTVVLFSGAPLDTSNKPQTSVTDPELHILGSNFYNSGHVQIRTKGTPRPIVIDGSNVAWGHGNEKVFSSMGIKVCSDFFLSKGHSVIAFVPRFRLKHSESKDPHILEKLGEDGVLKFTASREVNGIRICSYDDRYIVQFAADNGGIIVSNDNFRDLYLQEPRWRETILKRILQYTWINENYLMFPPDPLGSRGPSLDEFLRF